MKRKIVQFPNPVLRKKSKAVKRVTPATVQLINDMIEIMHAAPGIGLAAPQVGENLRAIVVDIGDGPMEVINPKIIKKSGAQIFQEGCLSLPDVEAPVERAAHILLSGLDKSGNKIEIDAQGLLATVFQHEIDHLDGLVFIDRVKDPSKIRHGLIDKKEEII